MYKTVHNGPTFGLIYDIYLVYIWYIFGKYLLYIWTISAIYFDQLTHVMFS